jgi:hypothetical protein
MDRRRSERRPDLGERLVERLAERLCLPPREEYAACGRHRHDVERYARPNADMPGSLLSAAREVLQGGGDEDHEADERQEQDDRN